ncbi:MAG: hypothetical protein ACLFUJ_02975 [Phycisphaerae bacterium]
MSYTYREPVILGPAYGDKTLTGSAVANAGSVSAVTITEVEPGSGDYELVATCSDDFDGYIRILEGTTYLARTGWIRGVPAMTGDLPGSLLGPGSLAVTITVTDGTHPLDGAAVWITSDPGGGNLVAGTRHTNAAGQVSFLLDPGNYYVWKQLTGVDFTNPQAIEVS